MEMKPFSGYNTGADMWHDNVLEYGIDEAVIICGNYLNMNLKREIMDDERNFSRELFVAAYEATAKGLNPTRIVYPYRLEEVGKQCEESYHNQSRRINQECSQAIAKAANDSCYKTNFYNLECAAWVVLLKYGFNRVSAVLAHQIQKHKSDGRYSRINREWAQTITIPDKAFDNSFIKAHAILIDGITDYVRKLYVDMVAERYALPGNEEHGEMVHGFEIYRTVMVDRDTGYALARNLDAIQLYVCWQFEIRDGKRYYTLGVYGSEQDAIDSFNARVFTHSEGYDDRHQSL